jgi:hypothetical protein
LAYQAPFLVVYIVFFVISVVRWRRHPRASLLAVVGLAMLTLSSISEIILSTTIFQWAVQGELSWNDATDYFTAVRMGYYVFQMVGMILILTAVFASRAQPRNFVRYDDPYAVLPVELTRPAPKPPDDTTFRKGNPP